MKAWSIKSSCDSDRDDLKGLGGAIVADILHSGTDFVEDDRSALGAPSLGEEGGAGAARGGGGGGGKGLSRSGVPFTLPSDGAGVIGETSNEHLLLRLESTGESLQAGF